MSLRFEQNKADLLTFCIIPAKKKPTTYIVSLCGLCLVGEQACL